MTTGENEQAIKRKTRSPRVGWEGVTKRTYPSRRCTHTHTHTRTRACTHPPTHMCAHYDVLTDVPSSGKNNMTGTNADEKQEEENNCPSFFCISIIFPLIKTSVDTLVCVCARARVLIAVFVCLVSTFSLFLTT